MFFNSKKYIQIIYLKNISCLHTEDNLDRICSNLKIILEKSNSVWTQHAHTYVYSIRMTFCRLGCLMPYADLSDKSRKDKLSVPIKMIAHTSWLEAIHNRICFSFKHL